MSDDETLAYVEFFTHMSRFLEAQAKHFNIAYIETSDRAFEQDLQRAAQQLLSS